MGTTTAFVPDSLDRLLLDQWLRLVTGKRLCGWCGCTEIAVCGDRCRGCFVKVHEQRVHQHQYQPASYLASKLAELEECREYLARLAGADHRWCRSARCGHSQMVHTAAGCTGLTGDDVDGWVSCRCRGFTADRPGLTSPSP